MKKAASVVLTAGEFDDDVRMWGYVGGALCTMYPINRL
jgi:hypothetical protein